MKIYGILIADDDSSLFDHCKFIHAVSNESGGLEKGLYLIDIKGDKTYRGKLVIE